jgi:diguanylate cyclase (GGDEF)-like protein
LNIAYEKLDLISRTDSLTQLSNRRDYLEKFQCEINRFERNGKPFTVVLADIDNFKTINDGYGHDAGDFILARLAELMKSSVRKQDIVARWGGEEFIFLLPQTSMEGGKILAEEIRRKIQDNPFIYNDIHFTITITIGLSEYNGDNDTDGCIKKADQALYFGKRNGKNCVFTTSLAKPEPQNDTSI